MAGETGFSGLLDKIIPFRKSDRERREINNDLMRANIEGMENRNRAATELEGLLAGTAQTALPQFTPSGVQLDAFEGTGPVPILDRNREGSTVPTIQTPEGQAQAQGLLAQLAPQQVAAGLLGSPRERTNVLEQKYTTASQIADERGLVGEARNEFIDSIVVPGGQGDPSDDVRNRLDILRVEREERDAVEKERLARVSRKRGEVSINNGIREAMRAAEQNQKLSDTALRTGQFSGLFKQGVGLKAAGERFFGMDSSESDQLLQDFGLFEKSTANLLLDIIPQLENFDGGSNARLQSIAQSLANTEAEPGANSKILADGLQEFLNIADINDFNVRNRKEVEGYIDTLLRGGDLFQMQRETGATEEGSEQQTTISFGDLPPGEE